MLTEALSEGVSMKKMTRMESSKECRRVLNRHGVDLSYCQYTCTGMEVRLQGWLCKVDSSDFTAQLIEEMLRDFSQTLNGFSVFGDFENWSFNSHHIQFLGEKASRAEEMPETYHISLDDYDFEAS